ncbi:hypothetical protein C8J57DRAFT_578563 [Mycena rebaudengoi]|nr:hypothetical protein C8J57DRAFT_578563 [Mycena rebaudengoi]
MSSPPAKRQRTDDAPILRSRVWHRDGTLILQADNTQFRIHRDILENSSFFRDMQFDNQDSPLVILSDSAVDVEYLLETLYNPALLTKKALPLAVIGAHVRLGRKYGFKDLLNDALQRLTFEYPTTLEEFDALGDAASYSTTRIAEPTGLPSDLVALATQNDLLYILPCAYYRAAIPVQGVVSSPRGDDTSVTLSPLAQETCILGREKLVQTQFKSGNTLGWLHTQDDPAPGDGCTNMSACALRREEQLQQLWFPPKLWALSPPASLRIDSWGLCSSCEARAHASVAAGRAKMWEALPGIFDLPSWTELMHETSTTVPPIPPQAPTVNSGLETTKAECNNCGATHSPLWRKGLNDEVNCNACGLYYRLHKRPRPRIMVKPAVNGTTDSHMQCYNCHTTVTPLWRKDGEGETVCNACGLHYKMHGFARPISMKTSLPTSTPKLKTDLGEMAPPAQQQISQSLPTPQCPTLAISGAQSTVNAAVQRSP